MIDLAKVRPRNELEALAAALLRRGADPIALALAASIGLALAAILYGTGRPTTVLLLTHAAFWAAGIALLRWLFPRNQPLKVSRAFSGLALSLSAGMAAVLLASAALNRAVPTPSTALDVAMAVPSLGVFLVLAPAAVVIGRRLTEPLGPIWQAADQEARRHQAALSIIFHELRRPLSTLVTAAELAMEPDLEDEERNRLLQTVHGQALKLGGFLEDILETARIQSGGLRLTPIPIDLRELVEELCEEFVSVHAEQDLEFSGGLVPLPVAADQTRMRMVLSNLLANAAKYSPEGSTVTVRVFREEDAIVTQVEDEGPGVPDAYRNQIFEQFFRIPGTTQQGFGLGLYIAKQIVVAHGGSMTVTNRVGRGACFTVALPMVREGSLPLSLSMEREGSAPTSGLPRPGSPGSRAGASRSGRSERPTGSARQ